MKRKRICKSVMSTDVKKHSWRFFKVSRQWTQNSPYKRNMFSNPLTNFHLRLFLLCYFCHRYIFLHFRILCLIFWIYIHHFFLYSVSESYKWYPFFRLPIGRSYCMFIVDRHNASDFFVKIGVQFLDHMILRCTQEGSHHHPYPRLSRSFMRQIVLHYSYPSFCIHPRLFWKR